MEAEEIYMNQQIKMQVVGSKVKKRGKPGNDEGQGPLSGKGQVGRG
jgi:hypothetical protein